MNSKEIRQELMAVLNTIEEHSEQKIKIVDLFRQLKEPKVEIQKHFIRNLEVEEALREEINQLKSKLACVECPAEKDQYEPKGDWTNKEYLANILISMFLSGATISDCNKAIFGFVWTARQKKMTHITIATTIDEVFDHLMEHEQFGERAKKLYKDIESHKDEWKRN